MAFSAGFGLICRDSSFACCSRRRLLSAIAAAPVRGCGDSRGDSPGTLIVEGVNDTGGRLGIRIMGRQVRGVLDETSLVVAEGRFTETVEMGDAMPEDSGAQVRIIAQRRAKVSASAAESQVYRAEYYRTV